MALDAGGKVGRFFPVVRIGSDLAGRCSLFECDSMLLDEGNEIVRGRGMDVIGVLGRLIVKFSRAERLLHVHLGASVLVDRVRYRHHAAERRFFHFGHIVLHDERIANSFHIDGHGPAVVRGGSAGCDMRMRAALILSVGKRQEPLGDVNLLKRDVHDGGNSRIGEHSVTGHGFLLSGY